MEGWIKEKLKVLDSLGPSHDSGHALRVRNLAMKIAEEVEKKGKKINKRVVEWAALLHDFFDHKYKNTGLERIGEKILEESELTGEEREKVRKIVGRISFRGIKSERKSQSLEEAIVKDADRLDAIGAIGIARAFAYAGEKGRKIYMPGERFVRESDEKEYAKKGSTINHFYEKLLHLPSLMETEEGKALAKRRYEFMLSFLDEFFREMEESGYK